MVPISHAGFANAYLADVGNQEISPLGNELLFKMTPSAVARRAARLHADG